MKNTIIFNIDNLYSNLQLLKNKNPSNTIMPVSKSNFYGLGPNILDYLVLFGVKHMFASGVKDALWIKRKYQNIEVYCNDLTSREDVIKVADNNIIPVVTQKDFLIENKPIAVNVNTCHFNPGFTPEEFDQLDLKKYNIVCLMTHLTWQNKETEYQKNQEHIDFFTKFHPEIKKSICCSSALLLNECSNDLSRCGNVLFGDKLWISKEIKPVVQEISCGVFGVRKGPIYGGYAYRVYFESPYIGYISVGLTGGMKGLKYVYGPNKEYSGVVTAASFSFTWIPLEIPVDRIYFVTDGLLFHDIENHWQFLCLLDKSAFDIEYKFTMKALNPAKYS